MIQMLVRIVTTRREATMIRKFAPLLLALALVLGTFGIQAIAAPPKPVTHKHIQKGQPTAPWMRTPCQYEDSNNCYWDAGKAGNGSGHSFYSVLTRTKDGKPKQACIFYTQARFAKWHDGCIDDPYANVKRITPDPDLDGNVG